MKSLTIVCSMLFLFGLVISPAAAQDGYHGGMDHGKGKSPHGMMMQQDGGMGMGQRCPMCPLGGQRMGRGMGMGMMAGPMHGGIHSMMMGGMAPSFYLDMKDKLGLEQQQIQELRGIRRDFRENFVRQSAELKIAAIDLEELFQGDWSVESAEKQLNKLQKLRTDLLVQYLKARKKAEQALTDEQLQMVRKEMDQ